MFHQDGELTVRVRNVELDLRAGYCNRSAHKSEPLNHIIAHPVLYSYIDNHQNFLETESLQSLIISEQKITCHQTFLDFVGSIQEQAAHKFILQSESGLQVRAVNNKRSLRETNQGHKELTPLHGPSKSCFKYLFSRDILLLGVNDILYQPGNL